MTKTRKFSFIIFGLLFAIASFLFVGCGNADYSKTSLISKENQNEIITLNLGVGEERYIDFTIVNPVSGMNQELTYSLTDPYKVSIEEFSRQGWTTKYKITGLKGGTTTLTVSTKDGNKSTNLEINVLQYSSSLNGTNENLFASPNYPLVPTAQFFEFDDGVTEKLLKYYFYGEKYGTDALTYLDVKAGDTYINEFIKAEIKTFTQNGQNEKSYLLLTNSNNEKFSIANGITDINGNISYSFVKINNENNESAFATCKSVTAGEKFYFVAVYQSDSENIISCERAFSILKDIKVENAIGYSYQRTVGGAISSVKGINDGEIEVNGEEKVTLIPNFTTLEGEKTVNYKVAYLKVKAETNSLLKLKPSAENANLLSGRIYDTIVDNIANTTTYIVEISSSSSKNIDTFYNLTFYYDGYETANSIGANYTVKVPVEIKVIPDKLFVNDQEITDVYTFYNHYKEDIYGWQEFRFSVNPSDATYSKIEIDLLGSSLQVRYKGNVYSEQTSASNDVFDATNKILSIADLEEVVFIKGLEGAQVSEAEDLSIRLCYDVFGQTIRDKSATLKYQILQGAKEIKFTNEEAEKTKTIYISVNKDDFVDASSLLNADASFSKIYFNHISGDNVAMFRTNDTEIYEKYGANYNLKFSILDRNVIGEGTYLVRLDNGVSITIKIIAIESLESITTNSSNCENNLVGTESLLNGEGIIEGRTYYVKNDINSTSDKLDIEIVANQDLSSKAILNFGVVKQDEDKRYIVVANENQNKKTFDVILSGDNGSEDILISVRGYQIDNFQRKEATLTYKIHVVSFSYIEKLNIKKLSEAGEPCTQNEEATNSKVYFNTSKEELRKVSFDISVNNSNAYLFRTQTNEWAEEIFDTKFVAWEYKGVLYSRTSEESIIDIDGYGFFDMERLSFTAKENVDGDKITLLARVIQYGKTYTYSININFEEYVQVKEISLTDAKKEINLTSLSPSESVIVFANNKDATNPEIRAFFSNNNLNIDGVYSGDMFEIESTLSDDKYLFTISAKPDFIKVASSIKVSMSAKLYIAAADWLLGENHLQDEYLSQTIVIDVDFNNGTEENRYVLTSEQDFLNLDYNAHYRLATTIDVSNIVDKLPLGKFNGSIIGTNEYAQITGINLTNNNLRNGVKNDDGKIFIGLFSSLSENSYIDNVTFSGAINIGDENNATEIKNVNIGLVAGENRGSLRNIAVRLDESALSLYSGNVGGIVGINKGSIIQDYSFTTLYNSEKYPVLKSYKAVVIAEKFNMIGYDETIDNVATAGKINFGGVSGQNESIIQKIDAEDGTSFIGYGNYFTFVNLQANKKVTIVNTTSVYSNTAFCVGAIAGDNKSSIFGSVATEGTPGYVVYQNYTNLIESAFDEKETKFSAGKGLIVGGQILVPGYEGKERPANVYDYIGGVAGVTSLVGNTFCGLTSRVFLRGDNQVAGIANAIAGCVYAESYTAFALQAVENGQIGTDASMIVVDSNKETLEDINFNKVAFGSQSQTTFFTDDETVNNRVLPSEAFKTFLSTREYNESADTLGEENKTSYYGDYLVIGKAEEIIDAVTGQSTHRQKIKHIRFTVDNSDISVEYNLGDDNINNKMSYEGQTIDNAYYAYYFEIGYINDGVNRASVQNTLDNSLNKMDYTHTFYPIKAIGELKLTSLTPEILTIDREGRITIKRTGLAKISATSILNQSNELDIYIYVVNYFNSTLDTSIVYPTQSTQSTKVDKSQISVVANNASTLYILPDYSLSDENIRAISFNSDGEGKVDNVLMSLQSNDEVSAQVSVTGLDAQIIGNQIVIRKSEKTEEKEYRVKISPVISFTADKTTYTAKVNKTLENVTASYRKGAVDIRNKVFDSASIYSSSTLIETVIVTSTADEENLDIKVFDENGVNFKDLFNIEVEKLEDIKNTDTFTFELKISVDTNSSVFGNRANENIYKTYNFVISAISNSEVKFILPITLEKTDVKAISIVNYKDSSAISSTDIAYPGEKGYMAISLAPIDGDFDYILVENADANYESGNAVAVFGLSARSLNANGGTTQFVDSYIVGSLTAKGIKFTREEILSLYSLKDSDEKSLYENFNGSIYVNYLFATNNVLDGSVSNIVVSACKTGQEAKVVNKPLTIKLPYYAKVSIADKEIVGDYYPVARGLEYKLEVETYGYNKDEVQLTSSDETLGTIVERNGEYYLSVTSGRVNYNNNGNSFSITITTTDKDRPPFVSSIKVQVQEFVLNYNGLEMVDKDVVAGMGEGIINVQIGSALKLELDLQDYIEYDISNIEIESKINSFMQSLVTKGKWTAKTNLNSYGTAPESGKTQESGQEFELANSAISNYYFKYVGYKITPVKTHEAPVEKGYYIKYIGEFKVENGVYVVADVKDETRDRNTIKTQFALNVFTSSSDQSPIPIFEYKDLLKMEEGGYYILLNNILMPNEETTIAETGEVIPAFSPITAKFASLDGNGLSLIFQDGKYDVGSASSIAPFASLNEGCIIKNLTVSYRSTDTSAELRANGIGTASNFTPALTYFETSALSYTFGGIVANNEGSITNCKVETKDGSYLSVYAPNSISDATEENYIGAIAGRNSGFITNSTTSANIQAPVNIGGIAGINDGKISGCQFKEGVITNVLSKSGAVAGIAVVNNENAQILTSMVRGQQNSAFVMSSRVKISGGYLGVDATSIISSPYASAGFVYMNNGTISDSYTDINLKGLISADGGIGYKISGFVGLNGGQIRNCFSLALLPSNRDSSSGFAETNKVEDKTGNFANCYYLSDSANEINVDLKYFNFDGVEALTLDEFKPESGKFTEYAYKSTINNESVWFYPNGQTNSDFVEYSVSGNSSIADEGSISGKVVFVGNVEQKNITFASGRLELVNPNTQVLSRRIFDTSMVDEETGNITYLYIDKEDSPVRGSIHNPHLIYDAQTMEDEILNFASRTGVNTDNYRLVSDIDYSSFEGSSNLYTVTFAGILEGNGMTISNIGLESNKTLTSAGLFAGVGYTYNKRGSVKNLNLIIERMNFGQAVCVGGVAGVLKYGEIHGVSVKPASGNGVTILGQNFVGGIVGKAEEDYDITDVYSEMSVSSSYITRKEAIYVPYSGDNQYSYAGSIAGYLGNGSLYNARVMNVDSIVAGKAGFMFGGIGRDANINYAYLDVKTSASIKSNLFAGLVAGEVEGKISHTYVSDNGVDNDFFDLSSRIPHAVGGIAGRLAGGTIANAVLNQTLNVNSTSASGNFIEVVGGLVGRVETETSSISRIYDCITTADIYSKRLSAGAVGVVKTALIMDSIAVRAGVINVAGQTPNPVAGGIVGQNESTITLTNSYCLADIELRTSASGITSYAYAGGIIANNIGVLNLSYIYTTSNIDAEVYESRAIGSVKDFGSLSTEEKDKVKFVKNVVNEENPTKNVKFNNVLYLGNNDTSYNDDQKKYILFRTKVKDADITFTVNTFGKSSNSGSETVDDSTEEYVLGSKDIMKNLFINRYLLSENDATENLPLFFKKTGLKITRNTITTVEEGFQGEVNKVTQTWMFESSDNQKLKLRNEDLTQGTKELGISSFTQINVYRDANLKIYSNINRKGLGNLNKGIYYNVFDNAEPAAYTGSLSPIWDFDSWGDYARLNIERSENLVWLNKATIGKWA